MNLEIMKDKPTNRRWTDSMTDMKFTYGVVTALKHPVFKHVVELWLYNVLLLCSSVRCQYKSSALAEYNQL